jgi:hypothetical protein
MDDDEREFGDSDARADMALDKEKRRRARWTPTDSDPYPDWTDELPENLR